MSELEHTTAASKGDHDDDADFSLAPRKSRLSPPQHQAQHSRLTDRTRLKLLKNTLLSKGAWQQVARIQDLRHTRLSPVAVPRGRVRGECLDAARLHHQRAEKTW